MREIKFRAFDVEKNINGIVLELSFSNIVGLGHVPSCVRLQNVEDLGEVIHYWDPHEIQENLIIEEFTGLKDKNGVEIFEGDILKIQVDPYDRPDETGYAFVEFCYGGFVVSGPGYELAENIALSDHERDPIDNLASWFAGDSEVVGNVREHSHLLEKSR